MKHFFLLFLLSLTLATQAQAADKMTVMLDWFVNPNHGPIIVAKQLGYFKDEGLDVDIIAPADPSDPPKMAAAGKVDLAVSYQPQLYLQHAEGLPLVRVGTLIDSPLYCVLTKAVGPIKSLADLKGHRVGFSVPGIEEALLYAMLRHNGVQPADVELVNVNFSLVPALASDQVDAVSGAFRNFEPHQLEALGTPGTCFTPEDNGIPSYDELIYVANPSTMNRDRIARFLKATARATGTIQADPETTWTTFKSYSADLDDALNKQAWIDTVPHLDPHPAELDSARYTAFGTFLKGAGLIPTVYPVGDLAVDVTQGR